MSIGPAACKNGSRPPLPRQAFHGRFQPQARRRARQGLLRQAGLSARVTVAVVVDGLDAKGWAHSRLAKWPRLATQVRGELKARLDRLPALAAKRSEVECQIAEAGQVLEQAEERHEATVSPLRMRLEDLKEQIWAGEQARHELWNTCNDPQLGERLKAVVAETADLQRTAAALRAGIERHQGHARADRDRADRLVFDSRSADLRKQADEHDAEAGRLQARLKATEKEIAAQQKRETAIRDEMLVP